MKPEEKLTKIEKEILKALYENKRPLTTSKIATLSKVSWNTAEKYLKEFHKKEWIIGYSKGKRIYYSAYKFR